MQHEGPGINMCLMWYLLHVWQAFPMLLHLLVRQHYFASLAPRQAPLQCKQSVACVRIMCGDRSTWSALATHATSWTDSTPRDTHGRARLLLQHGHLVHHRACPEIQFLVRVCRGTRGDFLGARTRALPPPGGVGGKQTRSK